MDTLLDLDGEWAAAYADTSVQAGITHASWYLAVLPDKAYVTAHLEGVDVQRGLEQLVFAAGDFSRWLRTRLGEITGFEIIRCSIRLLTHTPLVRMPPDKKVKAVLEMSECPTENESRTCLQGKEES